MDGRSDALTQLVPGMILPFAGDRMTMVDAELAEAFRPGDAIVVSQRDGQILHIRADVRQLVAQVIGEAAEAFLKLRKASRAHLELFFDGFADRLERDDVWADIAGANTLDVAQALNEGRDVTRLAFGPGVRGHMVAGLRAWATLVRQPEATLDAADHQTWSVEAHRSALGVIGFVFEGRPNVLVDACGVLVRGNSAVLRIGSDATGTAVAILQSALRPALTAAGLPSAAVTLVPPFGREAAWAMCGDARLALAVIRGSGPAVRLLGDLATQSGIPVSLHGAGGAWLVADSSASRERFAGVIEASLDRKVCNTLNTCCIVRSRVHDLVPALVQSLQAASRRLGTSGRLHVLEGSEKFVPWELFATDVGIVRDGRSATEKFASILAPSKLDTEWDWEQTPEITLAVVDDLHDAIELLNRHSAKFVASLIAEDEAAHDFFFKTVDAPFVGDGFTRWVDGQYALDEPELGLANWEYGRPLGRASVLTGAGVFTVRLRMRQTDPLLRR